MTLPRCVRVGRCAVVKGRDEEKEEEEEEEEEGATLPFCIRVGCSSASVASFSKNGQEVLTSPLCVSGSGFSEVTNFMFCTQGRERDCLACARSAKSVEDRGTARVRGRRRELGREEEEVGRGRAGEGTTGQLTQSVGET